MLQVDPDGDFFLMAVNVGFAAYDGYKAYKKGGWKKAAVAVGIGLVGGTAFKAVKSYRIAKGASRYWYKGTRYHRNQLCLYQIFFNQFKRSSS
ncbi:hypothetical protein [Niallia sp. 03133]|uniref:hypothetical protein n=1 Tax=Niallia sp. 03133 TaxID=3458060 RepID=UPI004044A92B